MDRCPLPWPPDDGIERAVAVRRGVDEVARITVEIGLAVPLFQEVAGALEQVQHHGGQRLHAVGGMGARAGGRAAVVYVGLECGVHGSYWYHMDISGGKNNFFNGLEKEKVLLLTDAKTLSRTAYCGKALGFFRAMSFAPVRRVELAHTVAVTR